MEKMKIPGFLLQKKFEFFKLSPPQSSLIFAPVVYLAYRRKQSMRKEIHSPHPPHPKKEGKKNNVINAANPPRRMPFISPHPPRFSFCPNPQRQPAEKHAPFSVSVGRFLEGGREGLLSCSLDAGLRLGLRLGLGGGDEIGDGDEMGGG